MKEFDLIKKAWEGQKPAPVLSAADIIAGAKGRKRTFSNKIIIQVVSLLGSGVIGIILLYTIDFKRITTFVGLALMFLSVFSFSCIKMYELMKLKRIDFMNSPKTVLQQLKELYSFRKFVHTTCTTIYFIVLNAAFAFYFIEVLQPLEKIWICTTIAGYTAWMLTGYFVLRKRQMKKDYGQIEEMIAAVRRLEHTFDN